MPSRSYAPLWPSLLYTLLIVYGSLYPFTGWTPDAEPYAFLAQGWPRHFTRIDTITNVLAYFPLSLLLVLGLQDRIKRFSAVSFAVIAGIALSLAMESLQSYLPDRHSSLGDCLTNGVGTLAGTLIGTLLSQFSGSATQRIRTGEWLSYTSIALLVLWALGQINLELPSLLAGRLHTGFMPAWEASARADVPAPVATLVYFFEAAALCLFVAFQLPAAKRNLTTLFLVFAAILFTKLLAAALLIRLDILYRLISLEAIIGLGTAMVSLPILVRLSHWHPHFFAITALTLLFLVLMLARAPTAQVPAFNITGLALALSGIWPMLAVGLVLVSRLLRKQVGSLNPTM
jgi:VanZ family protein